MLNGRQTERVLARMVERVPPLLTEFGYERGSCILHTRLAVDVLRELGIRARPMAARVIVGNASWARLGRQLGRLPTSAEWGDETWCVGIGFGEDPRRDRPGYDGHVFAVVDERWALDLTLDQTSRPAHGMRLAPHFWEASPEFLAGDEPMALRAPDESIAIYYAEPEERGYLTVPDWTMPRKVGRAFPAREQVLAMVRAI